MSGTSALLLGVVLGAMMGFDLGGPVNKAAYFFATGRLAAAGTADAPQLKIMAAVMAAGMVAPLAMALATTIRPSCSPSPSARTARPPGCSGVVHLRGRDPVRRGRPGAHHLGLVGRRLGGHRRPRRWPSAPRSALRTAASGCFRSSASSLLFLVALVVGVLIMTTIVVALKSRDRQLEEAEASATV